MDPSWEQELHLPARNKQEATGAKLGMNEIGLFFSVDLLDFSMGFIEGKQHMQKVTAQFICLWK